MGPQTAAAADEVVLVLPPADPPQRAHLSALQGQEPLPKPEETEEEIVRLIINPLFTEFFSVKIENPPSK